MSSIPDRKIPTARGPKRADNELYADIAGIRSGCVEMMTCSCFIQTTIMPEEPTNEFTNRSDAEPTHTDSPSRTERKLPVPFVTYAFIAICVVIYMCQMANAPAGSRIYAIGQIGLSPSVDIWRGQWYQLILSAFAHATPWHILFNMMWLLPLGRYIEWTLGSAKFLAIVLASAIVSSAAQLAWTGELGIGFSGVIYALFGFMWLGRVRYPFWRNIADEKCVQWMVGWAALCVVGTYMGFMRVANMAHIGGLIFGLSLAGTMWSPKRKPLWAVPGAFCVVLSVLTCVWAPWIYQWDYFQGARSFNSGQYAKSITWFTQAEQRGAPKKDIDELIIKAKVQLNQGGSPER